MLMIVLLDVSLLLLLLLLLVVINGAAAAVAAATSADVNPCCSCWPWAHLMRDEVTTPGVVRVLLLLLLLPCCCCLVWQQQLLHSACLVVSLLLLQWPWSGCQVNMVRPAAKRVLLLLLPVAAPAAAAAAAAQHVEHCLLLSRDTAWPALPMPVSPAHQQGKGSSSSSTGDAMRLLPGSTLKNVEQPR